MCVSFLACGHPATESECLEILRQSARLELGQRLDNDKELIDRELLVIEGALREDMMKQCVGKRISKGALECVRNAKTSDQVVTECLR